MNPVGSLVVRVVSLPPLAPLSADQRSIRGGQIAQTLRNSSWVSLKMSQTCHRGLLQPRGCGPSRWASDRYFFNSLNTRNFSARLLGRTHSADPCAVERAAARSVLRGRLGRQRARASSCPSTSARDFLISLPDISPVGWRGTAPSLRTSNVSRRTANANEGARCGGDLSESEDGIPVGSALVCVCVCCGTGGHHRHLVVARLKGSHVAPVRLGGGEGFEPTPESMPPIMHPPTVGLGGGLMSPSASGNRHRRPGSEACPLSLSCTLPGFTD